MKQDEGRGPQENTELYRAAMNHLRLPEDFEQRTLELAKKRMEQAQEKQAVKDVWRAKPFYRRPAAQVCFALLLLLVVGVFPVLYLTQPSLSTKSNDTAAVMQYDEAGGNGGLDGGAEAGEAEPEAGEPEAALTAGNPEEDSADEGCIPEAAFLGGAADGEVEEQASISSQDAAVEKQVQDTASSGAVPPDTGTPTANSSCAPQVFQEENPMPVQEGAGGSEAMDQSPTPGVMLRSTLEDAGQALFSADGGTLYFQPDPSSENGGKLMVWDGTTLSDTGVSNADSLLAANGGYSYTSENKLYHGTSLVRDFSGEALLGTSSFTLRVFGADSGYLYLFANNSNPSSGSDAPYAILRVTPDGTTEQILFTATGGSTGGKITQALLAENGVIYFSTEDGFYALPASGGQPRRLTANYTSVPFYLWEGEIFFIDAQSNLCAVQTNGGGARKLVDGRVLYQPAVSGGIVYYTLAASDASASNAIYALDLSTGDNRLVLTNTAGGADDFCQLLPAPDGLFLAKASGEIFHFQSETGALTKIS